MNYDTLGFHPEFPRKTWVVVEQPRNEVFHFVFNPSDGTFSRSSVRSLVYERGFSGVYGWVGGSGIPPALHHDILLFTRFFPSCGDILTGYVCGVFLRQNFDHKFVAVDDEIRQDMTSADLAFLDTAHYNELQKLYPRVDKGEGWYGAEVAYSHLPGKPLHE